MTPDHLTLEKILTLLQSRPAFAKAVAVEITRQREVEQSAALKKAAAAVTKLVERLDRIARDIERIQQADEQRKYLGALNVAAARNGHLTFNREIFEAALEDHHGADHH